VSVTRADIVRALSEKMGETQRSTEQRVVAMLEILSEALLTEGRVELRGFGAFEVREIKAHTTVLPATGEKHKVKKSYTVDFKPAQKLKTAIRQRPQGAAR
jgi:integration host factor subunit beta